ncbi:MAG: hypothetical protein ACPLY9_04080 [Nitrososphaerales archaeon]
MFGSASSKPASMKRPERTSGHAKNYYIRFIRLIQQIPSLENDELCRALNDGTSFINLL